MGRVIAALVLLIAACSSAPSTEQCTKSLEHLVELEIQSAGTKGMSEEMKTDLQKQKASISDTYRQQFMEACLNKTPKDVVECTISAADLAAAAKCDSK